MEYNSLVEVDLRQNKTRDAQVADDWMDALQPFAGTISTSEWGRYELVLTVQAVSLAQAASTALAVAAQATGREPVSVRVMTTADYDRWPAPKERIPELMAPPEAAEVLGISRQAVLDLVNSSQLPGVRVGGRAVVVLASAVRRMAEVRAKRSSQEDGASPEGPAA